MFITRLQLQSEARELGLEANVIADAGRTQIAAGSLTVLAVGPGRYFSDSSDMCNFMCTIKSFILICKYHELILYSLIHGLGPREIIDQVTGKLKLM